MVDTLSRADRTLEGRWWRRDVGGKMVRFVVCRRGIAMSLPRATATCWCCSASRRKSDWRAW